MRKEYEIANIHQSLLNEQRRLMTKQIDEYGQYDFWRDYKEYLTETYKDIEARLDYYADVIQSYHRIKSR